MFHLVYYGLEFLLCVIELILAYILVAGGNDKRFDSWIRQVLLIIGGSILIYMKGCIIKSSILSLVCSCIIYGFYFLLQFKINWSKVLFYVVVYLMCCFICDIGVTIGCNVFHHRMTMNEVMQFQALRYNNALISKSCNFIIILFISRYHDQSEEFVFSKNNLLILVCSFILSLICLVILDALVRSSLGLELADNKSDLLVGLLSICIFSVNIIVYWILQELNKSIGKEKEYALIQYQNELMIKATEENKELNNEWRRIRHDFNNHISCIDMLLQMGNIEKARAYIQKLTQNGERKELIVNIGNATASAILSQKMVRAKSCQIQMNIEGELPNQLIVEDNDLCALLSNALDNAIEATCQIEDTTKRQIELSMVYNEKNVLIKISNAVKNNIDSSSSLKTTKKDARMHGIGMRSMQAVVRKYSGSLSWKCEQQVFVLTIMLPR